MLVGAQGSHLGRWLGRAVALGVVDVVCLGASASAAYALWAVPVHGQKMEMYWRLWPLLGLFILSYARYGLYPGFGLGGVETLRRLSVGTSSVFVLLATFDFAFKLPQIYSRMTFAIGWALAIVFIPVGRMMMVLLARRWAWWKVPCVILGTGLVGQQVAASLGTALTLGYRPVGFLSRSAEGAPSSIAGLPVLGAFEQAELVAREGITVAIMVDRKDARWTSDNLAHLQTLFQHVLWVQGSGEVPVEGVRIKNLGGVIGVEYINQLLRWRNQFLKRSVDLTLGTVLALVTLPILVLSAVAVRLSSRGPLFYSQERECLGGRLFSVWKLRTMYPDAEARLEKALATDVALKEEWETRFKLKHDPRIVPGVGTLLRRFSLDELPQLWQVVAGSMSLVGPRPFPRYHLELFDAEILELRRRVRPGVTGLWQVKVRSTGDIELQQSHDAYYIRNWSLWMDLYVLGRTLGAVLLGRGAE